MATIELCSIPVLECFAPFVEYCDITGLSKDEVESIRELQAEHRAQGTAQGRVLLHWTTEQTGDYGHCAATGLIGTLCNLVAVWKS